MTSCGVFNQIKKKDGFLNKTNIKIYENPRSDFTIYPLYKTFDCDESKSTWASNTDEPYLMLNLINRELKISGFLYTRGVDTCYPTSLEVLGLNEFDWESVYINNEVSIASERTGTFSFNSNKYFSSFKFKQISNSCGLKYIEFYKIEVFGKLRNIFRKQKTCKRFQRESRVHFAIIIVLCYS